MSHWDIAAPQLIELPEVSSLDLRLVSGDVSVTATDGPGRLEVHALVGLPLQVDLSDGRLSVGYGDVSWGGILDWLSTGRKRREVSLALAVPAGCQVRLGTVNADAIVSGITAKTAVRTVSGEITLDGIKADITARTVSGNVDSVALYGDLTFETVSGDLTVVSGLSRSVTAKSVSGDIAISVELDAGGGVNVKTVSGDVVLRLPADLPGAAVGFESVSGRLTSAFDGQWRSEALGRKRLHGTFGDGSTSLRVTTVSGDIDLVCGQPA